MRNLIFCTSATETPDALDIPMRTPPPLPPFPSALATGRTPTHNEQEEERERECEQENKCHPINLHKNWNQRLRRRCDFDVASSQAGHRTIPALSTTCCCAQISIWKLQHFALLLVVPPYRCCHKLPNPHPPWNQQPRQLQQRSNCPNVFTVCSINCPAAGARHMRAPSLHCCWPSFW